MGVLNPDIRTLDYGKKEIKSLTIYPLSIKDQFYLTDFITKIIQELAAVQLTGSNELVFAEKIIEAVEENLGQILSIVADISKEEAEKILESLTNTQLADLIESIWICDYEPMLKKGKSLFDRAKSVLGTKKSSQNSSNSTPSTGSNTSIEKATIQED